MILEDLDEDLDKPDDWIDPMELELPDNLDEMDEKLRRLKSGELEVEDL